MDILIPENITGTALDDLNGRYRIERQSELWKNPERLSELVSNAKALLIRNQTIVDRKIIDSASSLQVIGRAGVGYDNIDVDYASQKGMVVCYTPDSNTVSTAELTMGLMMSLLRKIPSADKTTKEGMWDRFNHLGTELYNKKLGIVGFGKIGKAVAARSLSFGMKILVQDIFIDNKSLDSKYEVKSFKDLLSESDVVSIHLPLTKETKYLFNASVFDLMKPGSVLINTARGEIISEQDLIHALESGHLRAAALDVRENEPPKHSRLNDLPNVILTPHIGAFTKEAQERVINSISKDIDLVLQGKEAVNYVNFPLPKK